jgi:hypothetical protein
VAGTTTLQSNCVGGFYTAGNCYASAYGLHLDSSANSQYTLFADLNNDGTYTASPGEFIKNFSFSTGYVISTFCAVGTNSGSPVTRCSPSVINSLDIIFKRPNPDAAFTALFNGAAIPGDSYSGAYIQIQSNGDSANTKRISVLSTGEVSVCSTVGC